MKIFFLFSLLFLFTPLLHSQTYKPTDAGSKVHFVIKNFGFKVGGDFSGLKGTIIFYPQSPGTSKFNVTVNAATVDTDNSAMEGHLRKPEYFDVDKYPLIGFVSNKISYGTVAGQYKVSGNLTIKGITKPIQFDFSATPSGTGYVFTGEFEINRRDFEVGSGSFSLSDHLKLSLLVAARKEL
jgi:polyisoprenoid-binding protein YceI